MSSDYSSIRVHKAVLARLKAWRAKREKNRAVNPYHYRDEPENLSLSDIILILIDRQEERERQTQKGTQARLQREKEERALRKASKLNDPNAAR